MTSRTRIPWQAKYLALALIWGSSFLLMKLGLHALAPVQIAALRIFAGAMVLLVLLRATGTRLPRRGRVWGHLLVSSVFLNAVPFTGFALGETRVSSALAGIGNATTPLAAVLFGLVLLPSDRLTRRKLVAVIIGFLGVVTIMQPWQAAGRPDLVGFGIVVAAGMSYGLGWTYLRRMLADVDLGGLSQPTALLLCGSALMVPITLVWWALAQPGPAPWSLAGQGGSAAYGPILAVLVLGVVGTGLAYMLQFDVVRGAGVTIGSTVTYLIPIVSIALGVVVLGEHLAWPQLAGFAIVLAAAVVMGLPERTRRVQPTPCEAEGALTP
ncbi:MAG: DMT family transporter [Intrasporangium sp.]|uniref:DMT family transporter n=1 Tax=Intrasporangium sp. TaxID=1925024 RepID=UPI0026481245|nr:DMT family transporter [Intrasporangium sp.]MDN5796236.1 DMT family transporter [Intrasporangium sp.]